jgi:hypothetical protein
MALFIPNKLQRKFMKQKDLHGINDGNERFRCSFPKSSCSEANSGQLRHGGGPRGSRQSWPKGPAMSQPKLNFAQATAVPPGGE